MTRFFLVALGTLAGLAAIPVLADLPFPASAMLAISLCTVYGLSRGWAAANRLEADGWTAQRCWEILRDDRNPIGMQERAAARLARLGRHVVADPEGWWPWRRRRLTYGESLLPEAWRGDAYPFNGVEP
jgi:hypothetical protein